MDDLIQAGKIRYVGCSNFYGWQIARAIGIAALKGYEPLVSAQHLYNMLRRDIEREILPACDAEGLGMICWSPLASGMLSGKYRGVDKPDAKTRIGIRIRAGEADREMIAALGVDISKLYTMIFALGAALAGFAGALIGAIQSVQVGMGEPVMILAFVVIVIGGIGSIRGALVGALLVGLTDTLGRILLPIAFGLVMEPAAATSVGASLASMLIYILMAAVLLVRPAGLFGSA